MANNSDPQKKSFWGRVLEAWPIITFCFVALGGLGTTALSINNAWADQAQQVENNTQGLADLAQEMKDEFAKRAMRFMTETQFDNLWKAMEAQQATVDEFDDLLQQLAISDERVNAKIELEVERLRSEIREQANQQDRVLQQILREVQSD